MTQALGGIRILDLSDEKGALCGKLLADMGADVIKVEPPDGDRTRRVGPFHGSKQDPNRSLFFWHYNTSKRGITLDIRDPHGQALFRQLARSADVVIETFPPGTLANWGLAYDDLRPLCPRLIVASLTAFGQTGPRRHWRTSDTVAQAVGGMLHVNGHPHEPPLRAFGLQAYHSASTYTAIAVMLALLGREQTGRGQWIDVSLQECVTATVEHVSGWYHQSGRIAERQGSLHWSRSFRVGKALDGDVLHSILGDWTSLIEWVKSEGKAKDLGEPRWEEHEQRRDECEHLFDVLDAWSREHAVADLVEGAQLRRLPYAPVVSPEALLDDPQLHDRGFFVDVHHEDLVQDVRYPGAPYRLSATPWRIGRPAPRLGQHTAEILAGIAGDGEARQSPRATAAHRAIPRNAASPRILDGIRIVDFTWVVAGPVATRILCDQGADVVKIERRDSLDFGTRRGGLTGNLNRGKQSVVIDMNDARGVRLARDLAAGADVVIDNFSARVMANWGLDYERLRQINPAIIAVNMSGFGRTGPRRDYVSYGPTLQALSGYTFAMRHAGKEPAGWGFSYSDMAAGYSAALAVLLALWHRRQTGEGQLVDLSQFENLVSLIGAPLLGLLTNGLAPHPAGNRSPEAPAAPHGVYRCADLPPERVGGRRQADRWCAISVFGDADWQRFAAAIGNPPWTRDRRFATQALRLRHQDDLDENVGAWTREQSAEMVMETLQEAGVAAGIVADAEDLCERDPHLKARGYWAAIATPEGDRVEFDGPPFRLSDRSGYVAAPGPLLGEHTEAVLSRVLHLSPHEIDDLERANVIA